MDFLPLSSSNQHRTVLHVSIPSSKFSSSSVLGNQNFLIVLTYGTDVWEISRSFKEIERLHVDLVNASPTLCEELPSHLSELENYFHRLLQFYGDDIWNNSRILEFFDNSSMKSVMTDIRLHRAGAAVSTYIIRFQIFNITFSHKNFTTR